MPLIRTEDFAKIPYLAASGYSERVVYLLPLWDGQKWRLWLPQADGTLFEMNPKNAAQADYVAKAPAAPTDLPIQFVNFMWQRSALHELERPFRRTLDGFHNLSTAVAKIDHFYRHREKLGHGSTLFVATEFDYLLIQCRSIFDYLQETIAAIWRTTKLVTDSGLQSPRRMPPKSFSGVVLENGMPSNSARIQERYQFSPALADAYVSVAPFFLGIRNARDEIVHGLGPGNSVFSTPRGWCVSHDAAGFRGFLNQSVWSDAHRFNEALVSLRPLLGHLVFGTIAACGQMMDSFAKQVQFPPPVAPDYTVFVRGFHNSALVRLETIFQTGDAWWDVDDARDSANGAV
jgi:hypothetical protein